VTRGGSNTIFELLAMQKLHLIVPLGKKASRGDQLENAAYFEKKGYALTLSEEELTVASLNAMVTQLLSQREVYETTMRQSQEIQTLDSFYQLLMADIETIKK
ncbi:glycosyltransferase, partial [Streptococcus merionis]|uniref:glycosyltransferase n=1 Tax=Streptococcus merionis TaxID=400065 RepID=UPI0026EAE2CF